MEWFRTLRPGIAESDIRRLCTVDALPSLCGDIYEITQQAGDKNPAEISCVWGLFATDVEPIRNGVRYALITCPNALQWTVTTRNGETTLHCSINDAHPDADFAASIGMFLDKFHDGLAEAAGI
ncbi:MAG: hypothetical protein K8H84_15375 [Sulfuricella denitrificans]|nr:hypothetical protein [Sulfuricella denitrificans]